MYDLGYVPLKTSAYGGQAIARADATQVTTEMIPFAQFLTAWRSLRTCGTPKPTHMWHTNNKPCTWLQYKAVNGIHDIWYGQ